MIELEKKKKKKRRGPLFLLGPQHRSEAPNLGTICRPGNNETATHFHAERSSHTSQTPFPPPLPPPEAFSFSLEEAHSVHDLKHLFAGLSARLPGPEFLVPALLPSSVGLDVVMTSSGNFFLRSS